MNPDPAERRRIFEAYEKVRASGRYNMLMHGTAARSAAGLSREEYMYALQHYDALRAEVQP